MKLQLLILACFIASQTKPASKIPSIQSIKFQRAVYYNIKLRSLFLQQAAHKNLDYTPHILRFKHEEANRFIANIFLKASGIQKPTKAQRAEFIAASNKRLEAVHMIHNGLFRKFDLTGYKPYPDQDAK